MSVWIRAFETSVMQPEGDCIIDIVGVFVRVSCPTETETSRLTDQDGLQTMFLKRCHHLLGMCDYSESRRQWWWFEGVVQGPLLCQPFLFRLFLSLHHKDIQRRARDRRRQSCQELQQITMSGTH